MFSQSRVREALVGTARRRTRAPFGAASSRGRSSIGMPETLVGSPAVIACTTSCCVVASRSKRPALRPRRSTVIRSATAKTSWRLCEIRMTARPCSASRLTSASTCSVCATPSAAVGSSRITSFEFHITARATATDWRWPPESVATGCRIERIVVTRERLQRLGRALLHHRLLEPLERVVRLAAEEHVLDDVEVVAEREILVDDLDPEPGGVLRAGDVRPAGPRRGSRRSRRVDAGDRLDQRRLAGAVVADERHHLAAVHLEVDVASAPATEPKDFEMSRSSRIGGVVGH